MLKRFWGLFSQDLAIDLGTANTLICNKGGEMLLNEPSVVAIREHNGQKIIEAVGDDAKNMLGKTPGNIVAIRPLKDGVIADFQVTEKMLQYFIKKVHAARWFSPSPKVLVCIPCQATEVEKRAIRESVLSAGAREVLLIDEPVAAAIGAGLPVDIAQGSMVIDIGGGTSEIAILSLKGSVYSDSIRVGGDSFDEAITNYVRNNYGSVIGESTAECIKKQIGMAYIDDTPLKMEVRGRNLAEGIPRVFTLTSDEVLEAIQDSLAMIVQALRRALEQAPPELAADIAGSGIVLTGGGALLRNIDKLLVHETGGLTVHIADDPLGCVARGGGMALAQMTSKGYGYLCN